MLKIKIKLLKKKFSMEEEKSLQLIKSQIKNNQSRFIISFTFI